MTFSFFLEMEKFWCNLGVKNEHESLRKVVSYFLNAHLFLSELSEFSEYTFLSTKENQHFCRPAFRQELARQTGQVIIVIIAGLIRGRVFLK